MNLRVADRDEIERGVLVKSSYAVISIRSGGQRRARVVRQPGLRGVLYTVFDDVEPSEMLALPEAVRIFSAEQAEEIKWFVQQHSDVGCMVCHCEGGVSRSPAVAAAICRSMGDDDSRFFRDYQPNRYVYDLLLRCLAYT